LRPLAAVAGECPAGKMQPNVREKVDYKPVGVTDVTLGAINLEKQPANIRDRELRFRKLTIEPGGIVPWHSHDDRPALIFVQQGEIVEYASNCAEPIVHKAGEIRPEVVRHLALVEEPRQGDRHSLCRRRPQGSARPQHVTVVTSAPDVSLPDVTPGIPVSPHTPRRHILLSQDA
jgi:quercetin dioxygenase-like cupin family protein